MNQTNSFKIYDASAGSGKTFTLVKAYLSLLLATSNIYKFQRILAITFIAKNPTKYGFFVFTSFIFLSLFVKAIFKS